MSDQALFVEVKNVLELLNDPLLTIPSYQRPYTWSNEQLEPLLKDLFVADATRPLIMGTVILHRSKGSLNIVDGQQRLTTFSIFLRLLDKHLPLEFARHEFAHITSIENIGQNSRYISEYILKKGRENFMLPPEHILFIVVYAPTLEDAFTFFDSQNTRGLKLDDTDILKAHHLRFISDNDLAANCAERWEAIQKDKNVGLELLLENIIGQGRKFGRKEISEVNIKREFKSQRAQKTARSSFPINRYQQPAIFKSWGFEPVAQLLQLDFIQGAPAVRNDSLQIAWDAYRFLPFQLTQSVEGGELFFWFTQKYYLLYRELFIADNEQVSDFVAGLLSGLEKFNHKTGALYTYHIYISSLLFYFDKFGYDELDQAASSLFFAVYWLRFRQRVVQYASVFKFVREPEGFNPFLVIISAGYPGFVIDECSRFAEGKYASLWQSEGLVRDMFNQLISYVTGGYFSNYENLIPVTIFNTLKRR